MRPINLQGKDYMLNVSPEYGSSWHDTNIDVIHDHLQKIKAPHGVIIDIGANIGIMARILKDNIPNTGIVCIEPDAGNINTLVINIPEAVIHQKAISSIIGEGSLTSHGNHQTYRLNLETLSESAPIEVTTLDSLNIQSVMLIKIDVEGSELEVLKGAVNTIKKYKPLIYLEHHYDLVNKDELYTQIDNMNYQIIYLNGQTEYVHGIINNYLLTPKEELKY